MARRKNKQSRKYIPVSEFRYNNSPLAKGHPNYVFGKTRDGKKYKSFGITHSPDSRHIAYKLSKIQIQMINVQRMFKIGCKQHALTFMANV